MSKTVDERVVEMRFDNKQFESGVHESIDSLQELDKALEFKDADRGFRNLQNASSKFDTSPMQKAVHGVIDSFQKLEYAGMSAIDNLVNKITGMGQRMAKELTFDQIGAGFNKFGEKTGSVATLVSQGYDLETVNKQLDQLVKFTDETSYNFTDMVSNITKFTAAGQGLEDSTVAMEGIALWAALSGQNAATASRAMYQLSQAMGKGALRYDDYKSIQNANMDTQEFRHTAVDTAVALGVLRKEADDTYTLLADTSKNFTFQEMFSSDALTRTQWFDKNVMMEVFKKYSGAAQEVFAFADENDLMVGEVLEEYADQFDQFGIKALKAGQEARTFKDVIDATADAASTSWMVTFENIIGNYEQATKIYTAMSEAMWDIFIGEAGERRNDILKLWHDGIDGISGYEASLEGLANIWSGISGIFTAIGGAFENVFWDDVEVAAQKLIDWSVAFRDATAKFRDAFPVLDWVETAGDTLSEFNDDISNVKDTIKATVEPVSALTDTIDELAKRVIGGEFGSGEARFSALDTILGGAGGGHAVQNRVNEIMGAAFRYEDAMDVMVDSTEKATTDIGEILKNSGIDWSKYADTVWGKKGSNVYDGMIKDIEYNINELKSTNLDIADYLHTDYELTADDTLKMAAALADITKANDKAEKTVEDYTSDVKKLLKSSGVEWEQYKDKVLDENGEISEEVLKSVTKLAQESADGGYDVREMTKAIIQEFHMGYKDSEKLAIAIGNNIDAFGDLIEVTDWGGESETRMNNIYNIFSGLFSLVDMGKKIFVSFGKIVVNTIKSMFKIAAPVGDTFLQIAGDIGLAITETDKLWTGLNKFDQFANDITSKMVEGFRDVYDWLGRVREHLTVDPRFDHFVQSINELWLGIKQLAGIAWETLRTAFSDIFVDIFGDGGNVDTAQAFSDVIATLLEVLADGIDILLTLVPTVQSFIEMFAPTVVTTIENISTALYNLFHTDAGPLGALSSMWEKFTTQLEQLKPDTNAAEENVDGFMNGIADHFKNFDTSALLDDLKTGGLLAIFFLIAKVINNLSKITEAPKNFVDGIKDILGGIVGQLTAMQTNVKANIILKIAKAIGILALSFAVLTFVDQDALTNVIAGMTAFGLVIALILGIITKLKGLKNAAKEAESPYEAITNGVNKFLTGMSKALSKAASMAAIGAMALGIGAAVGILVAAMFKLAKAPWGEIGKGVLMLTVILGMLVGSMVLLHKFGSGFSMGDAAAIFALGAAISMIGKAIALIGSIDDVAKIQAAANAVLWIGLAFGAIAKMTQTSEGQTNHMLEMAGAMAIIAAILPLFAIGFKMFEMVDWGSAAIAGVVLVAVAAGMVFLSNALDGGKIKALLGFAGAMVILAASLGLIAILPSDKIMAGAVAMGVLVAAVSLLSLIADPASLTAIWLALTGIGTAVAGVGVGLLFGAMAITTFATALPLIGIGLMTFGKIIKEHGEEVLLGFVALLGMAITAAVGILIASQPMLIQGITALISIVISSISLSIPKIIGVLSLLLGAIGVFIIGSSPKLMVILIGTLNKFAETIEEYGPQLIAAIERVLKAVVKFIFEAIDGLFGGVISKADKLLDDGLETLKGKAKGTMFEGLFNFFDKDKEKEQLSNDIQEVAEEGIEEGKAKAKGGGGGNVDYLLGDDADMSWINTEKAKGEVSEEVTEVAETVPEAWNDGLANTDLSLESLFGNFDLGEGSALFEQFAGSGKQGGTIFGTNFSESASDFDYSTIFGSMVDNPQTEAAVSEGGSNVAGYTVDALKEHTDDIKAVGVEHNEAYVEGFDSSESEKNVREAGNNILDIIVNATKDSNNLLYNNGVNIIQGFINGINSQKQNVKTAITGITNTTNNTFTTEEDINSPSKVWEGYGRYLMMGFANGVTRFASLVVNAVTSMADDTEEAMTPALSYILDTLSDDIDSAPVIRPVMDLSDVNDGANRINSMFGGSRSYDLAMQANTSRLYSQRRAMEVEANTSSSFADRIVNGVVNGITSAMGDNSDISVSVYLEPDAAGIFRVVRTEANRFARATGYSPFNNGK